MVLGLIDFLLGGKKKTQVPKNAQVMNPVNSADNSSNSNLSPSVPDGVNVVTKNVSNVNSQMSAKPVSSNPSSNSGGENHQKRSLSEVISKIHTEIKSTNESVISLVNEIKDVKNNLSTLDHKVTDLEMNNKGNNEKLSEIDETMGKFLSLYELVNNQYNPFVEKEEPRKILISNHGEHKEEKKSEKLDLHNVENKEKVKEINLKTNPKLLSKVSYRDEEDEELEHVFIDLDTLNIEKAAGEAVPLMKIKSSTNSLVTILSWLEYLVKRVGIEETKSTLRYYTETLKWITPEVYFELDKFIRGMRDLETTEKKSLGVKDHIVSLYFISKLNQKSLDKKLTKAVLKIIKE